MSNTGDGDACSKVNNQTSISYVVGTVSQSSPH